MYILKNDNLKLRNIDWAKACFVKARDIKPKRFKYCFYIDFEEKSIRHSYVVGHIVIYKFRLRD